MKPGTRKLLHAINADAVAEHVLTQSGNHPAVVARRNELIVMIADVYEANYTDDEIEAIRAFMLSPVGRKMTRLAPDMIIQQTMAGFKWSQRVVADYEAAQRRGEN